MECAVGGGPQQASCVRSRDAAVPLYVQYGVTSVVSTGDQLPAQRFLQRISDLVLLDADPLERITNISRISAVLRVGRLTTRV